MGSVSSWARTQTNDGALPGERDGTWEPRGVAREKGNEVGA